MRGGPGANMTGVLMKSRNLDTETHQQEEHHVTMEMTIHTPRREAWHRSFPHSLRRNQPTDTLISDFWPPELWEIIDKFLLFKPPSLWYFVMGSPRKLIYGWNVCIHIKEWFLGREWTEWWTVKYRGRGLLKARSDKEKETYPGASQQMALLIGEARRGGKRNPVYYLLDFCKWSSPDS